MGTRRLRHAVSAAALVVAAALALTGCLSDKSSSSGPSGFNHPTGTYLVVERTSSGGYCANVCPHTTVQVYSDHTYVVTSHQGSVVYDTTKGRLTDDQWAAVAAATADPGELFTPKAERFCASAVDGIDVDFVLVDDKGMRHPYSSCTNDFKVDNGFFTVMDQLGTPAPTPDRS